LDKFKRLIEFKVPKAYIYCFIPRQELCRKHLNVFCYWTSSTPINIITFFNWTVIRPRNFCQQKKVNVLTCLIQQMRVLNIYCNFFLVQIKNEFFFSRWELSLSTIARHWMTLEISFCYRPDNFSYWIQPKISRWNNTRKIYHSKVISMTTNIIELTCNAKLLYTFLMLSKFKTSWVSVAHANYPSCSGGRNQEDMVWSQPGQRVYEILFKKYPMQKKAGRMTQVVEHHA
jgi:hypothetical protein